MGVSPRYVQDAKKLKHEAPTKFEAVKKGEVTLSKAIKSTNYRFHHGTAILPGCQCWHSTSTFLYPLADTVFCSGVAAGG